MVFPNPRANSNHQRTINLLRNSLRKKRRRLAQTQIKTKVQLLWKLSKKILNKMRIPKTSRTKDKTRISNTTDNNLRKRSNKTTARKTSTCSSTILYQSSRPEAKVTSSSRTIRTSSNCLEWWILTLNQFNQLPIRLVSNKFLNPSWRLIRCHSFHKSKLRKKNNNKRRRRRNEETVHTAAL
jgi:hypothetical protein